MHEEFKMVCICQKPKETFVLFMQHLKSTFEEWWWGEPTIFPVIKSSSAVITCVLPESFLLCFHAISTNFVYIYQSSCQKSTSKK